MHESFDVCVIGLGVIGAAATLKFARRGVRVVALDRFDLPHGLGSSGGPSRLIRKAYFEHPDYVPLLHRTYEGWDRLGDELGIPLLHRTGLVYLGPTNGPLLSGVRLARDTHSLQVETLARSDMAMRFPAFRLADDHTALFEPEAGFVVADVALSGMLRLAHAAGATLRARTEVQTIDLERDPHAVSIVTRSGAIRAEKVVIATGPWSGRFLTSMLPELGAKASLTVTRQAVGFVMPKPAAAAAGTFDLGNFPCFAIEERGMDGIYYGFPRLPGAPAMKCARHVTGVPSDPDQVARTTTAQDEALFRPLFRHLPEGDGPLLELNTCLYTMSADGHFIVGLHPTDARVTLACGFSGHGFKFGPVIGDAVADLTCDGRTALPIGFLDPARFVSDRP